MAKNNVTIQSDAFDVSTDDVISWIYYLAPNTVINKLFDTTNVEDIEISLGNDFSEIKINEKEVIFREQSFWYRRGQFNVPIPKNKILENRIAITYIQNDLFNKFTQEDLKHMGVELLDIKKINSMIEENMSSIYCLQEVNDKIFLESFKK